MDLATGVLGTLVPKLGELLKEEYKLQVEARKHVEFMKKELASMQAALRKVGRVPRDQLDEQVKIWAGEVRELSYQLEDVVDKFLVRVDGGPEAGANSNNLIKNLMEKAKDLLKMWRSRRQIAGEMKSIRDLVQEVAERRERYKVDDIVARPAAVDPRLRALYTKATELIGIGEKVQELMKLLCVGDNVSQQKLKTVSVVGFGGLGKTTLVKTVYDKIKGDFHCCAFVPVGRNPDLKKILRDILLDIDKRKEPDKSEPCLTTLDERQLINKLREFLENKRYVIVIDDIWEEKIWEFTKYAFSNGNNFGSRLITTTRIVSVSKACSSSSDDSVYQMKPLSDENSRSLFNRRVFESGTGCPPELQEVSTKILKKCGGVPLAIITIASLLASGQQTKSIDEWHDLLKCIGRGLAEDASVEEMQRILLFSYYDLPSHLKTCLLYLCIYPEDSEISKKQLIRKWVAENFVQCEKQETRLFELGEAYFNELVNRSMIQPVYNVLHMVKACRVHDMVLDLIRSLASEENFVSILDGVQDSTSFGSVRRLCIQNRKEDRQPTTCRSIRSLTVFEPAVDLLPPLSNFHVLRVLDLMGCNLGQSSLRDIGKLVHLRYLGLARARINELPAEVGELQFLLVLDIKGNLQCKFPSAVLKLRRLMCLNGFATRLPDGLGGLTSLEVLSGFYLSLNNVKDLRQLARLRKLNVTIIERESEEAFVESVCNLHNIQSLHFSFLGRRPTGLLWERWVPPRHLCELRISGPYVPPTWIKRNTSRFCNLCELSIEIKELQQEDLRILGRLPALRYIWLSCRYRMQRLRIEGFHSMISFDFICYSSSPGAGDVVFERGDMPKAESIEFNCSLSMAKDDEGNCDFDLGLGNLLSLRKARITIRREGVTVGVARKAEAALRRAADMHPNHPRLRIYFHPEIPEGAADDEVCPLSKVYEREDSYDDDEVSKCDDSDDEEEVSKCDDSDDEREDSDDDDEVSKCDDSDDEEEVSKCDDSDE